MGTKRKEMFIFHLHPVQRVNDRLSLTALLSTFLTPLIRFYLEEGCSYPIRKLGCACASPCLGVCLDCIKVSQLTNDHNDDDGPPPPSASAYDRVWQILALSQVPASCPQPLPGRSWLIPSSVTWLSSPPSSPTSPHHTLGGRLQNKTLIITFCFDNCCHQGNLYFDLCSILLQACNL